MASLIVERPKMRAENFFFADAHFDANSHCHTQSHAHSQNLNRHKHLKTKSDFDLRSPDWRAQTQLKHPQQLFDDWFHDEGCEMSPPPTPRPRKTAAAAATPLQRRVVPLRAQQEPSAALRVEPSAEPHRRSVSLIVNSSFRHSQDELDAAAQEPSSERKARLDKCVRRMRWLAATARVETEAKTEVAKSDEEGRDSRIADECRKVGAFLREISDEFALHRRWTI